MTKFTTGKHGDVDSEKAVHATKNRLVSNILKRDNETSLNRDTVSQLRHATYYSVLKT